jgi:hypothetical protein
MANTDLSDINEIYLGYFLAGESWFDKDAKKQVDTKMRRVKKEQAEDQIAKAKVMAQEVVKWAKANKYKGGISRVWWTARPGSMSAAVGREVDQRKNPADILVKFSSGPAEGFLGISAKSTLGNTDIGFKNPGLGTMESALGITLSSYANNYVQQAIEKYDLSSSASTRKSEIRTNPKIKEKTEEMGSKALAEMRDAMFKKLSKMSNKELLNFLLNNWLDSSKTLYPPYIKVTGMGSKEPYSAKVDDPLHNPKLEAILSSKISVEKVGNESVGVKAGSYRILKMRFKYESEKLASSIKLSGDPW